MSRVPPSLAVDFLDNIPWFWGSISSCPPKEYEAFIHELRYGEEKRLSICMLACFLALFLHSYVGPLSLSVRVLVGPNVAGYSGSVYGRENSERAKLDTWLDLSIPTSYVAL